MQISDLKNISEAGQSILTLLASIGFIYVLLMGLGYKKGRNKWTDKIYEHRKKIN